MVASVSRSATSPDTVSRQSPTWPTRASACVRSRSASRPERVLARLNQVVQLFEDDTLITALYGMIDPVRQTWTHASARHPPPVLRLADGTTTLLPTTRQPPLGLPADYQRFETRCPPARPSCSTPMGSLNGGASRSERVGTTRRRMSQRVVRSRGAVRRTARAPTRPALQPRRRRVARCHTGRIDWPGGLHLLQDRRRRDPGNDRRRGRADVAFMDISPAPVVTPS